jgi:hypothetical protein
MRIPHAVIEVLRRLRRLVVRVELTMGALRVAMWLGVASAVVGGALLVRRRLTAPDPTPTP